MNEPRAYQKEALKPLKEAMTAPLKMDANVGRSWKPLRSGPEPQNIPCPATEARRLAPYQETAVRWAMRNIAEHPAPRTYRGAFLNYLVQSQSAFTMHLREIQRLMFEEGYVETSPGVLTSPDGKTEVHLG